MSASRPGSDETRLQVRVLREAARFLLDLFRTRIAPHRIVSRTRRADVFRKRAAALAQYRVGEPRSTPVGDLQRFAQSEIELAGA